MLSHRIALLVLITSAAAFAALSAGPYDGKWSGTSAAFKDCGPANIEMVISNGAISGYAATTYQGQPRQSSILEGTVRPDGIATIVVGERTHFQGSIRFAGDRFDMNIQG